MRILVFEARDDERQAIRKQVEKLSVTVDTTSEVPSLQNVDLVKGYDGISVLGQGRLDAALLDEYAKRGIYYISTRTIGYNHIDISHARELGIHVCNYK